MANDKNARPLPKVTIDEAVGSWGPGPNPVSGKRQIGVGGDLDKLMRKITPPQKPMRKGNKGN